MKQRITIEQLQELSGEQKDRLRKLWKPEIGDMVYTAGNWRIGVITEMVGTTLYVATSGPGGRVSPCIKEIIIPLLSIGQCLELLQWPTIHPIIDRHHDWTVMTINKNLYEAKELIDALWEAVKEVL